MTTTHLESPRPSGWQRAVISLRRSGWALIALVILLLLLGLAVLGPNIAPQDPNKQNLILRLTPPFEADESGQVRFPLGTDSLGRDVLSRLIYGARISIFVGIVAVAIGGTAGTILGVVAGYFGGRVDDVIMRLGDVQLAFPFILLLILFLLVLGPGILNLVLILGLSQWVTYARVARGQTLLEREREYVLASRALGATDWRNIFVTILPNIMSPMIVIASFNVASVILAEAALSFLGLGVPQTVPTWGAMLASSRDQIIAGNWWLAVFPGMAIMFTVLSLNILGDWLRDFLDPRLRT
jgi:peptide/nickel transport system permease protein